MVEDKLNVTVSSTTSGEGDDATTTYTLTYTRSGGVIESYQFVQFEYYLEQQSAQTSITLRNDAQTVTVPNGGYIDGDIAVTASGPYEGYDIVGNQITFDAFSGENSRTYTISANYKGYSVGNQSVNVSGKTYNFDGVVLRGDIDLGKIEQSLTLNIQNDGLLVGDGYFVNYYTSKTSLFKAPDNDNDNVNVNIIKDLNVAGTVAPTAGNAAGILLDVVKANLNNVKTYGTITTAKIDYASFNAGGVAHTIDGSVNVTNVSNFASFSNNRKSFNMAGIVYTATGTSWAGSVSNYGTIVGVRGDDGSGAGAAGGKGQDVYAIANTISSQNVNSANIYNYGVVKAGDGGNGRRGADDIGGSDLKDDQTTNWLEHTSFTKSNIPGSIYYGLVIRPLLDNRDEYLYTDDNGYLTTTEEGITYLLEEDPLISLLYDDCYITSDKVYFIKKNSSWW